MIAAIMHRQDSFLIPFLVSRLALVGGTKKDLKFK
jgi:hypothetical protein